MIIGVDAGYFATKTSEGIIFPSCISLDETGLNSDITIGDKSYVIGRGKVDVDFNKINKELTKVCILYALARSSIDIEFDIVTGLPINQYKSQKDELKNMLQQHRINTVYLEKVNRTIIINRVEVFPQGVGALYSTDYYGDLVLVDIGGRTIDIVYFRIVNGKRKIANKKTIYEGTLNLYSNVVDLIMRNYPISLNVEDGEKILKQGFEYYGIKQDISFLKDTIKKYCENIIQTLLLDFPVGTVKVVLTGGGALLLKGIIEKRIPNCTVMNNPQFANAIGFKRVGEGLWGK